MTLKMLGCQGVQQVRIWVSVNQSQICSYSLLKLPWRLEWNCDVNSKDSRMPQSHRKTILVDHPRFLAVKLSRCTLHSNERELRRLVEKPDSVRGNHARLHRDGE